MNGTRSPSSSEDRRGRSSLLFVTMSIHAGRIAGSADLRSRAAQTLVIFAALLLLAVLLSIPVQPDWVLGAELLALAVCVAIVLIILDHLAGQSDSRTPMARTLDLVNPSTLTAGGVAVTDVLLLCGVSWADLVLSPPCAQRWSVDWPAPSCC